MKEPTMSKPNCFGSNPNSQEITENCCNDCPFKKECFEVPEKEQVTGVDIVMLEAALNLKALSSFEENFLANLQQRFKEFGFKMVITEGQRRILEQLHDRYKKTHSTKQDTIAALHYYYSDRD